MNQTKPYDFTGKVALITGSSSGIGAAIALQLPTAGARVTITGRNRDRLEQTAVKSEKPSNSRPLQIIGDLAHDPNLPAQLITETVDRFGRLDFVVHCAGGG